MGRARPLAAPARHHAIAACAAPIEGGIVPGSKLETCGSDDSRLPMSGMASYTPGMEISGGSLGQGLPIAVAIALALIRENNGAFVCSVTGNDPAAVGAAFGAARALADPKPRVILFDTPMGKGVPFLEQREKNHSIRVDPPAWQPAVRVLDQSQPWVQPEGALA